MSRLVNHFSKAFSYGLDVDAILADQNATPSDYTEVEAEIERLLEEAAASAQRAGKLDNDIREATFAIVAWLDERMAMRQGWRGQSRPMQVRRFSTSNAGNEFFEHLERLSATQAEVREVYYMCLCLGFVGEYFFDTSDSGPLGRIKDNASRQLPLGPAVVHRMAEERLRVQPYKVPDPKGPVIPSAWDNLILRSALTLAILVPLGAIAFVLLQAWFARAPAPARPDPRPLIAEATRAFECAQIGFNLSPDYAVQLTGFVSKDEDRNRLINAVRAIPGVSAVSSELDTLIWPFCEVMILVTPNQALNRSQQMGFAIEPVKKSFVFRDEERIALDITMPNYQGYVYVDYYQLDGTVVHMLPNVVDRENAVRALGRTRVGEPGPGRKEWKIQPPFGRELVVALASPQPLFPAPRVEYENAAEYLPVLRRALQGYAADPSRGSVPADTIFLLTQPAR